MTTTDRPQQTRALDARDDMLAIAAAWPDLLARLGRESSNASDGMPRPATRAVGLVINEHVSQTMSEIREWVTFLSRVLIDETDTWMPPHGLDTPRLLVHIAVDRIGHFTQHPDEGLRLAFFDDAKAMRAKVEKVAYPDGVRTIVTRASCEEFTTSDLGERIPCPGKITARPTKYGSMPDLICSEDKTHRTPPEVFMRAGWRKSHEEDVA